jgi:hypothetical protein
MLAGTSKSFREDLHVQSNLHIVYYIRCSEAWSLLTAADKKAKPVTGE